MKLHLPKTLLAAVLALAPCAVGATTYGWDNDNGVPTATEDGGAATAIAYPTAAADAAGNVVATGTDPLFYNQTAAITSLTTSGQDVKLQLTFDNALSGTLTAASLWLTGTTGDNGQPTDKQFAVGTSDGQARISADALYLVGSQMKLTSTSSAALEGTKDIFIGWTRSGSAAAANAAIYAAATTTIVQDINVVDSAVSIAGSGSKIAVQGGSTLTLSGNINAKGKTLVVTGYGSSGTLKLSGTTNSIGDFYLSGAPDKYNGPGYGVKLVLSEGTTTIGTLNTIKVSGNENSICVKDKAELILTGGIQASLGPDGSEASLLMVEEGGKLTFTSGFTGELNSYLSLSGAGTVSNAGTLSLSGSVNLSNAIVNTGSIVLKNGASFELGGLIPVADITQTSLQNATYTFVDGGIVTRETDASITFTLGGEARTDLQWSDNYTGVYDSSVKVYNIAAGGSQTYSNISTAFTDAGCDTGEIYVFGTLEALNTAPAYAVKGTGIVEITGNVILASSGKLGNSNLQQFAGTIQIKSGILQLDNQPNTIKAVDHVEVFTGGTLQAWSTTVDKNIILKGGTLKASDNSDWKGDIEIQSASELQSPGDAKISGDITGNGAITKTGKGTLTTTGNVSLANTLTVSAGTMEVAGETTFGSGYSKEGTGTLKITGHATVGENATVKLNETTLAESTATFSGKGAVENAGTTTASVTLKDDFKGELSASAGALSAQWENAALAGKSLALASATGGNLTVTNVGSNGISITDIEIGADRTVGVYTGGSDSTAALITLKDTLTANTGSVLGADLSASTGSTLTLNSSLNLGGNDLLISGANLSGDLLAAWGSSDSITLFTNVGGWAGTGVFEFSDLEASWFFGNVGEWDNRYNYTLSSVVADSAASIILNRSEVPEPGTAALSLLALVGLCARRRRRK